MMRRLAVVCISGILVLCALGCGKDGGPQTVAVSGTVYLDDKPLAGVEVNFYSEQNDFLATGVTGEDGRYELFQGAVVGENKVWITRARGSEVDPAGGGDPAENPELDVAQAEAVAEAAAGALEETTAGDLPAKFSDPDKTILKYVVPEGGSSNADFRLKSE